MFIPWYMYMQFFLYTLLILFKIHQAIKRCNLRNVRYNSTRHKMMLKKRHFEFMLIYF